MACTGRQWVDLTYFNPDWPLEMQMVIHRIERDDAKITEIEAEVTAFLSEVDEAVADLRARYMMKEAA